MSNDDKKIKIITENGESTKNDKLENVVTELKKENPKKVVEVADESTVIVKSVVNG